MQRIIKSAFPCASTYVHTYVCLCVCVRVFRELLSTWDLLYKCDIIKQAITIAITTKRFDMYTNKLSSAYRVGGGKSQERQRERERDWKRVCVCVCVKARKGKRKNKSKSNVSSLPAGVVKISLCFFAICARCFVPLRVTVVCVCVYVCVCVCVGVRRYCCCSF